MSQRLRNTAMAAAAALALPLGSAAANPFATGVRANDLDLVASGTFHDDKFAPAERRTLIDLGDAKSGGTSWSAGSVSDWKWHDFHHRLAFTRDVSLGTMLAKRGDTSYAKDVRFRYLKPDAEFPGDPAKSGDWQEIPAKLWTDEYQHTFPPGVTTRAVLLSEKRQYGSSTLKQLIVLSARLQNVTPYCMGQGQQSYGAWWPMDIPHGKPWHGAGTVGEDPIIWREPVSDVAPSWFILSRDERLRPVAMRFRANITDFRLYAFTGDDKANPALAPVQDWERIAYTAIRETPDSDSPAYLLSIDNPIDTRAVKLILRATTPAESKVAVIDEWTVWEDLQSAATLPPPAKPPLSPFTIEYEVDTDAEVALVIDHPDGTRARNVFAQVAVTAGTHVARWNMKDDWGAYLPVGKYTARGIYGPPLELFYGHTFYPNVEMHSPKSHPWGAGGHHGWLGNHANNTDVCVVGDRLFIGTGGTEGGHGMLECTFSGEKTWGSGMGVQEYCSDGKSLFMSNGGTLSRLDPKTKKVDPRRLTFIDATRLGKLAGMAARDNHVYMAFTGRIPYFSNAAGAGHVDIDACLPKLPVSADPPGRDHLVPAAPQQDFLRLFRLTGEPAGLPDPGSLVYIPSTDWNSHKQYVVLAFKEPTAIGSLLFPRLVSDDITMTVGLLKPDAPYPPNPKRRADWVDFDVDEAERANWEMLPAPPNTVTRAIRLTFAKAGEDGLMDGFDESMEPGGELTTDLGAGDDMLDALLQGETWQAQVEGMRLLRRRFKNLFSSATVRVNSGEVDETTGAWDAKRTEYLSGEKPGVYVLEWDTPQPLTGLAIKEIDGEWTAIDIFTGPGGGAIDIDEPVGDNWRQVDVYRQRSRSGAANSLGNNASARYLEGFVNFGEELKTRAVRLRVSRQWAFSALRRPDQGGSIIDHRRCAVHGVAPLQYIGGEKPTNDKIVQRLSVYDWATGDLVKEAPSSITGAMAFNPEGQLHAVVGQQIARIDLDSDKAQPASILVKKGLISPRFLDFDSEGNLYVYDHARDVRAVLAFDRDGKHTHDVGRRGHPEPGRWDPSYMIEARGMTVGGDNLYVNYPHDNPRRTLHFKTDGTFVQEFLGNTYYGGGGTLDRYDSTIGFYMDMVFKIDWETHTSKIVANKAYNIVDTSQYGRPIRTHMVAVMVDGRKYHVSVPLVIRPINSTGFVYLFDEETMTHRLCAAVGACNTGTFFAQPEFIELLDGRSPGEFKYIFGDRNGDGKMQPSEVEITPIADSGFVGLGRFDTDLGIMGGTIRYEVERFLPDGTPIYREVAVEAPGGYFRLNNGNYFGSDWGGVHGGGYNRVADPAGKTLWTYPASFDVSGLYIPPWWPGHVANQFSMIGHAVEDRGELGEFFVMHANTALWNVWTADGLLASRLTRHARDPERRGYGNSHAPGARMTGLSPGQEHFHGFFCKTEDDGRYRMICGDDAATIIEVRGFDKFKRFSREIEITPELRAETLKWEAATLAKNIFSRSPMVECYVGTPLINGVVAENEWGSDPVTMGTRATFHARYNPTHIYFCWRVAGGNGPFENEGDDFRRYFKTGAAVDVQLSIDPGADPDRSAPAPGDMRLLIAHVRGTPKAVLYRPHAPGAPASDAWETTTYAGGTTKFDQVIELPDAQIAVSDGSGYTVEAAVPLAALGLAPEVDMMLKFDWGVISTDKGDRSTARNYWVNSMAVGVNDEPTEARIHPDRWGYLRFHGEKKGRLEALMDDTGADSIKDKDIDDVFDDMEMDL